MSILKRPPGDLFTFRLFFKLTSKITVPCDKIYLWATTINPYYQYSDYDVTGNWKTLTATDYRTQLTDSIKSNLVVIGLKDHLTSVDFNKEDTVPDIAEYLIELFDNHIDKTFILLTSVEGLDVYIKNLNVSIIPWGGDITNHQKEYKTVEPVLEKNLDSSRTYLSLNRNKRTHREMLIALLHALGWQKHGLISCMFKDTITDIIEYTKWKVSDLDFYSDGWNKLLTSTDLLTDSLAIYEKHDNDNVSNFKNSLKTYYENTFVEIISETSYTESCYNLTEKTLNSVYGCSFPILLCSKGSVDFLRSMGLDMFDDIVDHSYDAIDDPAARLEAAIIDNTELLTNNKRTKDLWVQNKTRFENNVDFCRERLYNYYSDRAVRLFDKEISNELQGG